MEKVLSNSGRKDTEEEGIDEPLSRITNALGLSISLVQ